MLDTADRLLAPPTDDGTVTVKGRTAIVIEEEKVARFTFWPLSAESIEALTKVASNPQRAG